MEYKRFNSVLAVRLNKGEEITGALLKLIEKEKLTAGSISGIGATDDFCVGVFDLQTKCYKRFEYSGNHEIVSLCGNISAMNGAPYLHLHISCADADGRMVGGHLLSAKISLTAEILIHIAEGSIERRRDEELGINLWEF